MGLGDSLMGKGTGNGVGKGMAKGTKRLLKLVTLWYNFGTSKA